MELVGKSNAIPTRVSELNLVSLNLWRVPPCILLLLLLLLLLVFRRLFKRLWSTPRRRYIKRWTDERRTDTRMDERWMDWRRLDVQMDEKQEGMNPLWMISVYSRVRIIPAKQSSLNEICNLMGFGCFVLTNRVGVILGNEISRLGWKLQITQNIKRG